MLGSGDPGEIIKLGTCAWSFDDWRDVFYPPKLESGQLLSYYAQYLPAVEVDSTFYHIPRPAVVAAWANRTPNDFVFTAKMPRLITHQARLRNCRSELDAFLRSLRPMGEKLGAILLQFSPAFQPARDADALADFLKFLPTGKIRFAVEFRHPDWHRASIAGLLADHGVAWTWNDLSTLEARNEAPFGFLPQTADFLYVRLMGDLGTKFTPEGERFYRYGSLLWSRESALELWAKRLEKHLLDMSHIYILVNNHFEGMSPLTCQRLATLLGIEIKLPSLIRHAALPGHGPVEPDHQLDLL